MKAVGIRTRSKNLTVDCELFCKKSVERTPDRTL